LINCSKLVAKAETPEKQEQSEEKIIIDNLKIEEILKQKKRNRHRDKYGDSHHKKVQKSCEFSHFKKELKLMEASHQTDKRKLNMSVDIIKNQSKVAICKSLFKYFIEILYLK
jgi:hypothetical protein